MPLTYDLPCISDLKSLQLELLHAIVNKHVQNPALRELNSAKRLQSGASTPTSTASLCVPWMSSTNTRNLGVRESSGHWGI